MANPLAAEPWKVFRNQVRTVLGEIAVGEDQAVNAVEFAKRFNIKYHETIKAAMSPIYNLERSKWWYILSTLPGINSYFVDNDKDSSPLKAMLYVGPKRPSQRQDPTASSSSSAHTPPPAFQVIKARVRSLIQDISGQFTASDVEALYLRSHGAGLSKQMRNYIKEFSLETFLSKLVDVIVEGQSEQGIKVFRWFSLIERRSSSRCSVQVQLEDNEDIDDAGTDGSGDADDQDEDEGKDGDLDDGYEQVSSFLEVGLGCLMLFFCRMR